MADKTLRVCLSSDLPPILERDPDYLYFVYDKLWLYAGQNKLDEDFVVCNYISEDPVENMMYIQYSDGDVHRFSNYQDHIIANIEDQDQLELLAKVGTSYLVNSDRRYYDSQQRSLVLPFNDGVYELVVSMKEDQVFDNDTIMKFNEDTEQFEIYGDTTEEYIDYSKPLRGGETNTVKVKVDGSRLIANIKVSGATDNLIRAASDGLYVKDFDLAQKEDYENLYNQFTEFKAHSEDVMDYIDSVIAELEDLISEESIEARTRAILSTHYDNIDEALANYEEFVSRLDGIEDEVMTYASDTIINSKNQILDRVEENSSWADLDNTADTYQLCAHIYHHA